MTGPKRRAWNSTLPSRSTAMARTKGLLPGKGLKRTAGLRVPAGWPAATSGPPRASLTRRAGLRSAPPVPRPRPERKTAKETGFPRAVKKACRRRAGYCCEACRIWLGEHGGQVQHRDARGMGGSSDPVTNSAVNALLLCGTPSTGHHGLCESRDRHANAMGFWLGEGEHPALTPVLVGAYSAEGGTLYWLTPEGGYSETPRAGTAAA